MSTNRDIASTVCKECNKELIAEDNIDTCVYCSQKASTICNKDDPCTDDIMCFNHSMEDAKETEVDLKRTDEISQLANTDFCHDCYANPNHEQMHITNTIRLCDNCPHCNHPFHCHFENKDNLLFFPCWHCDCHDYYNEGED